MSKKLPEPLMLGAAFGIVLGAGMSPLMFVAGWLDYDSFEMGMKIAIAWLIGLPLMGLWLGLMVVLFEYVLELTGW